MAEIQVFRGPARFSCLGLGSCIGLCALDADSGVGGMAHILLPTSYPGAEVRKPGRFADLALPALLGMMERLGARRKSIVMAYAGGAQVFNVGSSGGVSILDIGARNSAEVARQIDVLGITGLGCDVGGSLGRTVSFDTETGDVKVRTITQGDKLLCNLRGKR